MSFTMLAAAGRHDMHLTAGTEHAFAHHHEGLPMIYGMERRGFIRNAGLLAGAAATTTLTEGPVLAQTSGNREFKPMTYQTKTLPFDQKGVSGLSEKILVSHYENNYVGAVK